MDWIRKHSERLWTAFAFGVLLVGTFVFDAPPGALTILIMVAVGYSLAGALNDFVKVLDPELRQYAVTPLRRHIWGLGVGALLLIGWSTMKVEPLPSGIKLDMEAVRTTARLLGVGIVTGLIAGGLIAAARVQGDSAGPENSESE